MQVLGLTFDFSMARNIENYYYQSVHLMSQATLQPSADQDTEHNLLICLDLRTKTGFTQQETFPKYVHSVPNTSAYSWCDQISPARGISFSFCRTGRNF